MKMAPDTVYLNNEYADNELARFARRKYRKIYSSDTSKHDIGELNLARKKLVRTKGSGMIKTDWMYEEVIRYLFKMIRTKSEDAPTNSMEDLVELFKIIQASYKTILMNDDTSDLEDIHVALTEAIHEWAFRYRFDAHSEKVIYGAQWKREIEDIANKLVDELHYREQASAKYVS